VQYQLFFRSWLKTTKKSWTNHSEACTEAICVPTLMSTEVTEKSEAQNTNHLLANRNENHHWGKTICQSLQASFHSPESTSTCSSQVWTKKWKGLYLPQCDRPSNVNRFPCISFAIITQIGLSQYCTFWWILQYYINHIWEHLRCIQS
jgi:hypothetical protein